MRLGVCGPRAPRNDAVGPDQQHASRLDAAGSEPVASRISQRVGRADRHYRHHDARCLCHLVQRLQPVDARRPGQQREAIAHQIQRGEPTAFTFQPDMWQTRAWAAAQELAHRRRAQRCPAHWVLRRFVVGNDDG